MPNSVHSFQSSELHRHQTVNGTDDRPLAGVVAVRSAPRTASPPSSILAGQSGLALYIQLLGIFTVGLIAGAVPTHLLGLWGLRWDFA